MEIDWRKRVIVSLERIPAPQARVMSTLDSDNIREWIDKKPAR